MLKFEMKGFDKLKKTLEDAQRAMQSLDGKFATLSVDPNNPELAIAEMERAIDAKLAQYRGNELVDKIAASSKESFRKAILQKAEEVKRSAPNKT